MKLSFDISPRVFKAAIVGGALLMPGAAWQLHTEISELRTEVRVMSANIEKLATAAEVAALKEKVDGVERFAGIKGSE